MSFAATWMNLEIIKLSDISQRQRQIYDITYMWNLKISYKWIYLQNRSRLMDIVGGEGLTRGFGLKYTLLYLK